MVMCPHPLPPSFPSPLVSCRGLAFGAATGVVIGCCVAASVKMHEPRPQAAGQTPSSVPRGKGLEMQPLTGVSTANERLHGSPSGGKSRAHARGSPRDLVQPLLCTTALDSTGNAVRGDARDRATKEGDWCLA